MLLSDITDAVANGDSETTNKLVEEALEIGYKPIEIIEEGLARGLRKVGQLFEKGDLFIPDLVVAADAMHEGVKIVEPKLLEGNRKQKIVGKVIFGTVKGDIHDIGKNIVIAMLRANGFIVHDLGVDVPPEKFVEAINEWDPDIVCLSAMTTITILQQKVVIEKLEENEIRKNVKVLVGGAVVSDDWVESVGADAYASDAITAIQVAKSLLEGA